MLIFGSYATEASEPGQILTEAALRNVFRVPWECLGGVNCGLYSWGSDYRELGARPYRCPSP